VPLFEADFQNWLLDVIYAPVDRMHFTGTFLYTRTDNYDEYLYGLPLGADYDRIAVGAGVAWQVREHCTLEPKYRMYLYHTNPDAESGGYTAHVLSLELVLGLG
jgi:hypothetical protein